MAAKIAVGIAAIAAILAGLAYSQPDGNSHTAPGRQASVLQFEGWPGTTLSVSSFAGPLWVLSTSIRNVGSSPISVDQIHIGSEPNAQVNFLGWVDYKTMSSAIASGHLGGGDFGWGTELFSPGQLKAFRQGYRILPGHVYQLVIAWSLKDGWGASELASVSLVVNSGGQTWTKTAAMATAICQQPSGSC